MKRFTFTLEPVRRIREQQEQLVQVELAAVLRERAAIAQRLEQSRTAERELYEYLRSGSLSASELHHISRYDTLHRQKIVDAVIELGSADDRVGRVRQRLVAAQASREALDRLRDRQKATHRQEQLAEEARELDEIGSMRRMRLGADEVEVITG